MRSMRGRMGEAPGLPPKREAHEAGEAVAVATAVRATRKPRQNQSAISPAAQSPKKSVTPFTRMRIQPKHITEWLKIVVPKLPDIIKAFAFVLLAWKAPELGIAGMVALTKQLRP